MDFEVCLRHTLYELKIWYSLPFAIILILDKTLFHLQTFPASVLYAKIYDAMCSKMDPFMRLFF